MSKVLITLINFYQAIFSPDHSFWAKARFPYGYCKFVPSCSQYLKTAIQKRGLTHGLGLAVWRFLRCNPFVQGRIDKVK